MRRFLPLFGICALAVSAMAIISVHPARLVAESGAEAPVAESAPAMLRSLLAAKTDEAKAAARAKLLKSVGPDQLRDAARGLIFDTPETPSDPEKPILFRVPCPDGNARAGAASLPADYDGTKPHALVVILHGGVSRAPARVAQQMLLSKVRAADAASRSNVIYVSLAAECDRFGPGGHWWRPTGIANVLAAVAAVKKHWNIDDDRVFVTGMSDGGSGSFAMAGRAPDTWAGAFPMVGSPTVPLSENVGMWWQNFSGVKVYSISGGKDTLYPGATVLETIAAANESGASIETKLYEDAGHDLSYLPTEWPLILSAKIGAWKRPEIPTEIDWSSDDPALGRREWISIDGIEVGAGDFEMDLHLRLEAPFRAMLGVSLARSEEGSPPLTEIVVEAVTEGSVAEEMGVEAGDVITAIDGTEVKSQVDLRDALGKKEERSEVKVSVRREGKVLDLEGRFGSKPDAPAQARVVAKRTSGLVTISAANASKISLWTCPAMCGADGTLRVEINGHTVFNGRPTSDAALLLSEYERTGDRAMRYCGRIQLDVPARLSAEE